MKSAPLVLAAAQMDVRLADKGANLTRIVARMEEAAGNGARLVVVPECALTGYCFNSREEALRQAEEIPGAATDALAAACRKLHTHLVVGMLERDGERLFNAGLLVGPEGVVGVYRKTHLPFLGVDMFTTPGEEPFAVHAAAGLRVGMNICYDGAFPEPSRVMALAGADLIVLPTNWPPGAETTADYVINARAVENHVYYAAVNRVGVERSFRFIGKSRICDPYGRTIAVADHEEEAILYATIDPELPRNKHLVRVPGKHEIDRFADRRPDLYAPLCDS